MKARTLQAFTMNNEEGPITFRADRLVGQPRDGLLRARTGRLRSRSSFELVLRACTSNWQAALVFVSPVFFARRLSGPCFARRAFARCFALGARASGSALLLDLCVNTTAAPSLRAHVSRSCEKGRRTKQKALRFRAGLAMLWCPGEDSNLHGVTR